VIHRVDILPLTLVGGALLVVLFLVIRSNAKRGELVNFFWRRFPKYENLDKNTMGRIAGRQGMIKKEGGFVDIRYKTGVFSAEIDRDIPQEFIKTIEPPETPIGEGIVRVYPHTIGKPTYYRIWDFYKELISFYEQNFNLMLTHLENLKLMMKTKIDKKILLENLDELTTLFGKLLDNLKARKAEIVTYALEPTAGEKPAEKPEGGKK